MPISTVGIIAASRQVGGGGITATFQASAVDAADLTTYTFSSQPIGTASATRRVVVGVTSRSTNVSSITIGGVSATLDNDYAFSSNRATIASAVVPTGTTANVVVTFAAATTRCGLGVWTLNSGSPTGQTGTGNGTAPSATVTTTTGDVVIAASIENGTVGSTATWTGATERYDQTVESDLGHTGADTVASGSSTNVSIAWSATSGSVIAAAAYA